MTDREIEAMHGKPALITTHSGAPVSLGRIRVRQQLKGQGLRVEITFETEAMACTIRIPSEGVPLLHASFEGGEFRHVLPEGDKAWLGDNPPATRRDKPDAMKTDSTPVAAIIETFPLPAKSRLIGPVGEQPHPKLPGDGKRAKP